MDITKMLSGIRLNPAQSIPLYLQIATALSAKISDFSIPVGAKLPPERELSRLLGVSRTTAINAYSLLEERGLVSTKIGSGTFVSAGSTPNQSQATQMPWDQLFAPGYKAPLSSIIRSIARRTKKSTEWPFCLASSARCFSTSGSRLIASIGNILPWQVSR